MRLPPPNRVVSWHTGYTRDHWTAVADHLLEAVVPYAVPGFAQIRLPGRQSASGVDSDGLEGYARTFLLAAFRGRSDLLERYAEGLAHGTDPASPYAWPALTDNSQQIVEAASIAIALHETGMFADLDPGVRERVVAWLGGITGTRVWPCNWVLFKAVIQQFLANVGAPHDPAEIKEALDQVESWYAGDGWYTDGAGQNYDYYCGWAMHLYTLWWARMAGAPDQVYRDRLRLFLAGYRHFFGGDGAPVHQGRSLTYRFAAAAPLWLGALFDATPLSPGTTRRMASGVLRYFLERGAVSPHGLLTLGWHGPFLPVTQSYSGPASPYWASKAFIGLLLPADHPVWTAPEETAPVEEADHVVALPAPGWLLHSTRHDGIVRLLNHGSDHNPPPPAPAGDDPHYSKLAYSTHAAPEAGEDGWVKNVDNHLAVIAPDGTATRRRRIERIGVTDRFAASRYTDGEITVETAAVARGPFEIRVHRVTAPAGHTVRDGGYAVPAGGPVSRITPLHGWRRAGVSTALASNAYGPDAATPYLEGDHPGGVALYASLVMLGGDPADTAVDARVDGERVTITFPDGELVEVRLGDRPSYLRRDPAGNVVTWEAG